MPTTVEVLVFNPVSGEILSPGAEGVRFEPDSTVTALLRAEDQVNQVIVMANVEPGVYRGSAALPAAGTWTIDVAVTALDCSATISPTIGSIEVAPTFAASDGRRYYFSVTTVPVPPEANEEITIRLRLVDAVSGAPMSAKARCLSSCPIGQTSRLE